MLKPLPPDHPHYRLSGSQITAPIQGFGTGKASTPLAPGVSQPSPQEPRTPAEPLIVDFGGGARATVSEREIHYKDRLWDDRMTFDAITGICYGALVTKLGPIPFSWAYKLALTNGKQLMLIERGAPPRQKETETQFRALFDALWHPVTSRLVGTIVRAATGGPAVTLGGLTIDSNGLTSKPARSFGLRLGDEELLAWNDLAGHTIESGMIYLFRKTERKPTVWASLSFRDTWNAVCLGPALTHLYQSGALRRTP